MNPSLNGLSGDRAEAKGGPGSHDLRSCAGLMLKANTLKPDYSNLDGGWNIVTFEGVLGSVKIEVSSDCLLSDEVAIQIAEVMAAEAANDDLPRSIVIEEWSLSRAGNIITAKVKDSFDQDPDYHMRRF